MSIQSAMQAGVAGLGAQSRKFATISDNIANSETVGYKRTVADFASQVADASSKRTYSAGGVTTNIVRQIEKTGIIRGSDSGTDLAINGDGFFIVKGGLPATQSAEPPLLTRVGSSYLDKDGYLRLQNGYYVQGIPLDPDTSLPTTGEIEPMMISQNAAPPVPSTTVDFRTNLPVGAFTTGETFSTTMTYVDQLGTDRPLRFDWTPVPDAVGVPAYWNLKIYDNNSATPVSNGGALTWDHDNDGGVTAQVALAATNGWNIRFDSVGTTAGLPATGYPVSFTINAGLDGSDAGTAGDQSVAVTLDLTQYDYSYNPVFETDGVAVSDFASVEVSEAGILYAIYEDGSRQPQYRLAMAEVANPAGLRPENSNAYSITLDSGDLIPRFAGEGAVGTVQGFALEGSNVDIAEELTQMITTQRVYTANASIITTSDEMLEEAVRLKR